MLAADSRIFGLHSLIKLLCYRRLFFHIDATFDGAPRGFYQVVIFSVTDDASGMHMPIFYCTMTKKSEEAYNLLWENIVAAVGECVSNVHVYYDFMFIISYIFGLCI